MGISNQQLHGWFCVADYDLDTLDGYIILHNHPLTIENMLLTYFAAEKFFDSWLFNPTKSLLSLLYRVLLSFSMTVISPWRLPIEVMDHFLWNHSLLISVAVQRCFDDTLLAALLVFSGCFRCPCITTDTATSVLFLSAESWQQASKLFELFYPWIRPKNKRKNFVNESRSKFDTSDDFIYIYFYRQQIWCAEPNQTKKCKRHVGWNINMFLYKVQRACVFVQ